jgi:hypothetical protein
MANKKHRKRRIFFLDHENGKIEGQGNLKNYITGFYKCLFGEPEQNSFSLDPDRTEDIAQVTQEENNFLTVPFTEDEIKKAIFEMEHNKAPGLDGFPIEFYQKFWDVIKGDLITMFQDLYDGDLPIFSLNFGVITFSLLHLLIPPPCLFSFTFASFGHSKLF